MRDLALHQITMMDGGPEGLVRFAKEMGISRVCLFTASPAHEDGRDMFPVVAPDDQRKMRALLDECGVSILNAEYFPVTADHDVTDYLPAIDCAAALGAKRLITHIHETMPGRAEDQLAALCSMARERGLEVGLEFTGFAAGCNSLQKAVDLHGRLDQSNLAIAVDALHLFRTGGTLTQLEAADPAIIGYAQLCDGPDLRLSSDYLDEAMNRMLPGQGVFPLQKFVTLLGPHVDIDIEVPCFRSGASADARIWAREAIAASRLLFLAENDHPR